MHYYLKYNTLAIFFYNMQYCFILLQGANAQHLGYSSWFENFWFNQVLCSKKWI